MNALQTLQTRAAHTLPQVAVILGSGWDGLQHQLRDAVCIPYAALDGFPVPTVGGHAGQLWLGRLGTVAVAVLCGRQHPYEGGSVSSMKVPLQVLKALGCTVLVQTNAAGSLRADMPPASLMLLSDHINLPQRTPLLDETGTPRFVNLVDAYDPGLRTHAHAVAHARGIGLHEGVYAWAFGPQFETPAEIRMLVRLGADAVGMSTVPETILARYLGLRVLALSLITNMGAGLSGAHLSHAHTLQQAQASAARGSAFLAELVAGLPLSPPLN